jgi:hypothetical protein
MRRYHKPLGWPLLRRRLYDVSTSTPLHTARGTAFLPDPSTLYLTKLFSPIETTLHVTPAGRYFLLIETRRGSSIRPLWRFQARSWMFRNGASPERIRAHFPRSFEPA